MKELIKLFHIETEREKGFRLQDFNLTIGSGEVIYLVANTDVEKYQIKDILIGANQEFRGSFYLDNRKQMKWDAKTAYDQGIFYVDERHQLAMELNIMENVCAIRSTDMTEVVMKRSQIWNETKEILDMIGLFRRPDEKIERFTHFERQLVCIAKMLYHGTRLLILDGLENKYNRREILHMKNLVSVLAGRDIAVLFLHRQPEELLSVCTRCVLLRQGSDGKILFQPEITREKIAEYRISYSQARLKSARQVGEQRKSTARKFSLRNRKGEERKYRIVGYYDIDLDSNIHFREYLNQLNENQVQITLEGKTLKDMLNYDGKALMIGMNSVEELMYNLNLGENLAFAFRYMEKSRRVLLNHRFCSYLRMEFLKKFHIRPDIRKLEELSYYEKKLLSVYRWLQVGTVESIFLEEPYLNLQGEEIEGMKQYMWEICREYAPLGIFSKNVFDLTEICDAIIVSCGGQFLKYYEKDEFEQILVETTKMMEQIF